MKELLSFYKKELKNLYIAGKNSVNQSLFKTIALAFARIDYRLQDSNSQLSKALLQLLFPSIGCYTPGFGIVQLKAFFPNVILQGTFLKASMRKDKRQYYFKTVYEVPLTTLHVKSVKFTNRKSRKSLLAVVLRRDSGIRTQSDCIGKLRFYINMSFDKACVLYELLFNSSSEVVAYLYHNKNRYKLENNSISHVGLTLKEFLLSNFKGNLPPEQLLVDFFILKEKFLFFDINLPKINLNKNGLVLLFHFSRQALLLTGELNKESLILNCTPIINLFEHGSEYIKFDHKKNAYKIVPQTMPDNAVLEVYDVLDVKQINADGSETKLESFNRNSHFTSKDNAWSIERRHVERNSLTSENIEVLYLILSNNYIKGTHDISYLKAELLCSHKFIQLNDSILDIQWESEEENLDNIKLLNGFLEPLRPIECENLWYQAAFFSISTKQLIRSRDSLTILKKILQIGPARNELYRQKLLESLLSFNIDEDYQLLFKNNVACYVKGLKITMVFNDRRIDFSEFFLFWKVFYKFFSVKYSLYAPITFYLFGKYSKIVTSYRSCPKR